MRCVRFHHRDLQGPERDKLMRDTMEEWELLFRLAMADIWFKILRFVFLSERGVV